jgi:hypothetical protein
MILMMIILTNVSDNNTVQEPVGNNDVYHEDNATELPAGIGHHFFFK